MKDLDRGVAPAKIAPTHRDDCAASSSGVGDLDYACDRDCVPA